MLRVNQLTGFGIAGGAPPVSTITSINNTGAENDEVITLPTGIVAGDILFLHTQTIENGLVPFAIPDWTLGGFFAENIGGFDYVGAVYGKIATGAENSQALVYTDNAGDYNSAIFSHFRGDVPASALTPPPGIGGIVGDWSDGNPGAGVINSSALVPAGFALCCFMSDADNTGVSFSPANDSSAIFFTNNSRVAWKIYNVGTTPVNHTVDIGDSGTGNGYLGSYWGVV
jgi:hypothetical protein